MIAASRIDLRSVRNKKEFKIFLQAHGIKKLRKLGSGAFGSAYKTDCGRVIKISNKTEEEHHMLEKVIDRAWDFSVKYYDFKVMDDYIIILMEYVELSEGINELYKFAGGIKHSRFHKRLSSDFKKKYKKEITDILDLKRKIKKIFTGLGDFHSLNIGYDSKGTLKYFDYLDCGMRFKK